MRNISALLWLCLLTASHLVEAAELRAGVFSPTRAAPDFSLRGSHGAELKLSQHRGKVVLLGFGFTNCPEVCPVTLGVLASARRQLGALARDVQVLYITVDPQRDTPQRMHEYLSALDPTFIGGTGSAEQLERVRNEYGVFAGKKQGLKSGYVVPHSSFVYLIDRRGNLRALMPYGQSPADYAHDLKLLLRE